MIKQLNGTLVYVQAQKPVACYVADKGFEVKSSIVVDEDTADAWEEVYSKQAAKAVKTSEFEALYKIPAPYPDQKKQFIITLRKNTKLANGESVPAKYMPKVMERTASGNLIDVTNEKLPANGSLGAISVEHYAGKMGDVARLKNVLVTSMIEYEGGSSDYEPGDEFADTGSGSVKVPPKAIEKAQAASKAKPKAKPDEFDLEDSPF